MADAIDGARTSQSRLIEITLRYNLNTLEQTVLAAIAWAGLALALPHEKLMLIPAMAVFFVVGRALFWIGYLIAPVARALGLGLSAYPPLPRSSGSPGECSCRSESIFGKSEPTATPCTRSRREMRAPRSGECVILVTTLLLGE